MPQLPTPRFDLGAMLALRLCSTLGDPIVAFLRVKMLLSGAHCRREVKLPPNTWVFWQTATRFFVPLQFLDQSPYPADRTEQLEMLADPCRAHLARPAAGADPEFDRLVK